MFTDNEDELLFAEDDENLEQKSENIQDKKTWKVMIADDEEEIHTVTKFALSDYQYKGSKIEFINAYTGKQAVDLLVQNPDVALILLDVVMENNDAGLQAVDKIRNELNNQFVRIVLRTGQPGQAPEEEVILKYDINDYKNKTELTDKKLFTAITTGLRSYSDIIEVENFRQNLEQLVVERTAELQHQKLILERKNNDIMSSINYAFRIQDAMLSDFDKIQKHLPEFFIFFQPKDIVSGDFYWFGEKDGKVIISAIDCTGHGVPGAFMSMVGDAYLNQIILIDDISSTDVIAKKLHQKVRQSLKQDESQNRDGMELGICIIDKEKKGVEFTGAGRPLLYVQNGELHEIKADRQSIGGRQDETDKNFTSHFIAVNDIPTTFYMFSDGLPDQFGGKNSRKMMIKHVRETLLAICDKPLEEQGKIINKVFNDWKGSLRQTDDVLVIGFKVCF
ncbi:MAG: response regulator [Bacteroidetes bacterium]|nr:MAG: response regulator [Bacteroidota bacterium]